MKIHYRVSGEGIEIVRCFGTDSQVVIPEQIEGKPVIKAAPYAFSARKDKEEIDVQTYDTDQIGQRSAEEKLLAGDAVEEVVFPDTMREIGRYIFYGCRNLKKLEFSDNLMQIGSGAFTVCGNLQKLIVHLQFGSKSCVKEILGELWQRMDVTFVYENGAFIGQKAELGIPTRACTHRQTPFRDQCERASRSPDYTSHAASMVRASTHQPLRPILHSATRSLVHRQRPSPWIAEARACAQYDELFFYWQ